jgi:hypothetical protein
MKEGIVEVCEGANGRREKGNGQRRDMFGLEEEVLAGIRVSMSGGWVSGGVTGVGGGECREASVDEPLGGRGPHLVVGVCRVELD